MINFYEGVRNNPSYNSLEIGDLLFAEYTCGVGDKKLPLWSHSDYLVNVITGRKTWHTSEGSWVVEPGETLFFKKGATIVEQHFELDFCLLMFFIPDDFIRGTVRELADALPATAACNTMINTALRVENDVALSAFFQSMRTYFSGVDKPSEALLRLKMKELVVSILTSGKNPALASYFRRLGEGTLPSVVEIMEANFRYNLTQEEYARMCHRSLSSFKRDFQSSFGEAPGKWLLRKRLDYSAALLKTSSMNVTEIAFESGFEDVSHFSRVFKDRFNVPPVSYRQASPGEA